jgi:hypothetical protein
MRKSISDDVWRDILNRLVLRPRLKAAARSAGINPSTLFIKIRQSIENPDDHMLTWLDRLDTFANHVSAARRLSIVELDRAALTLGLEGHSTPRYHDGKPCFVVDLAAAADALTLDELSWIDKYGTRRGPGPDADTYARDKDGKLIQEMVTSPPNAQLVSKLLTNLLPNQYSETQRVEHHHSGSVWIEGQTAQLQLPSSGRDQLGDAFGSATPAVQQQRQTNLLALPRPCIDVAEFNAKYRDKKLLRVVTLFRDSDNKLLPPLPSDVIIAGSRQHLAFSDAQIPVEAVRAETLLDEGYQNPELYELAPAWKPKKPKPPTDAERAEIAKEAKAEMAKAKPYRSMEDRAEGIGRGTPAPNGRRVSP